MKKLSITLLLAAIAAGANAQTAPALTQSQVAFGDANNLMTSSPYFKYVTGQMTMESPSDNYITLKNGSGTGHFQFDDQGRFVWWTPYTGDRMMCLTNEGQLRIGTTAVNGSDPGLAYKLRVKGFSLFEGLMKGVRTSMGSAVTFNDNFVTSINRHEIEGATAHDAYYSAQENTLYTSPGGNNTSAIIGGYQTAAQKNTAELNGQVYSDQGAGQVWSVQTNTFYAQNSTFTKYINTYVRTQLGANNSLTNYYSLFLESPFGAGNVSQISNYYGMYQESAVAKNYFAGNVGIGTTNPTEKLAVNGTVKCVRLVVKTGWADFVFHPQYQLPSLREVEAYIKAHGHLSGVATAEEVEEKGADVGETQKVLLQKVEELTLYMIELNKKIDKLEQENETLRKAQK